MILFTPFLNAGGTFALYSLLCRHAQVKTIPNQHRTDEELTTYSRSTFQENSFAAKTKKWLEASSFRKNALLLLVLVGTCMVIGDGILTPAISGKVSIFVSLQSQEQIRFDFSLALFFPVLSASGGIKVNHPKMGNGNLPHRLQIHRSTNIFYFHFLVARIHVIRSCRCGCACCCCHIGRFI